MLRIFGLRAVVKRSIFLYTAGMRKSPLLFTVLRLPTDILMLFAAGIAAYFLRVSPLVSGWRPVLFYLNLPFEKYIFLLALVIPFGILIFAFTGLYKVKRGSLPEGFFQITASVSFAMMAVIIYIFIQREWFDSRFILVAAWGLSVLFVFFGRIFLRLIERYFVSRHQLGIQRVLLIGGDRVSQMLSEEIQKRPRLGFKLVKQIDVLDMGQVKLAVANPKIDTVIVGQADYSRDEIVELAEFCQEHHLNFHFAPTLFQTLATNIEMNVVGGVPLIEVRHTPLYGWGKILKRALDVFGSIAGIIGLAPLFCATAAFIKLESKGPVFVGLDRVTMNRHFKLYKFRSMIDNAHLLKKEMIQLNERNDGPLFKMKNDPRVTRVGRFLRRARIDELPQLFNVLRGDMSLVGPRPHEPEEVAKYEKHHKKLLTIKSGMTGMAQVSGSSDLSFEEEVKLDTYYIENWSPALDIKILLKTLVILFKDRSAC